MVLCIDTVCLLSISLRKCAETKNKPFRSNLSRYCSLVLKQIYFPKPAQLQRPDTEIHFLTSACKDSKYVYPAAGHVITGNLKIISDSRIRSIIAKGPKYRFPVQIDFQKCREKIAGSLNEFCNRWCKRENVECDALKDWKLNIFKIIDRRISFYSQNTNMLPRKPKISYRYLKSGIEEFHRKYVLVPADKAANNVVVV